MTIRYLLLLVLFAFVLSGCKSSAERQDDTYLRNQGLVDDYSQRWPAFKEYLKAGDEAAAKLYNEAAGLDEDAYAAKLKQANQAFGAAFLALREHDQLKRSIRNQMDKLNRISAKSHSTDSNKKRLWKDTDRLIEETDQAIAKIKPKNEGEGAAEVLRQVDSLQTLDNRVSSVLSKAEAEVRIDRSKKSSKRKKDNL